MEGYYGHSYTGNINYMFNFNNYIYNQSERRRIMLKDIKTKDLVKELQSRSGVISYKIGPNGRYKIEIEIAGLAEDTGIINIKKETGPAIILEIID